ncbi:hypothetical protein AGRA3207_003688 [Actinomadura graeca]|uniref:Uncharacterized protein n=1 Tax=Actinomadura graeca TaxID=2750812 RepID=A0ABX8QV90_9ACTN|nr:hypothetical protein [Actinomadura graeca]QXJ22651.1 hypothetical protein AGRA3207_003688 [Actinomadura graeca]
MGERVLIAEEELPVSGWRALLYPGGDYWWMLYLFSPAGSPVIRSVLKFAAEGQMVIGAHRRRAEARWPLGPVAAGGGGRTGWAFAYGAVGAEGPPRVRFSHDRALRPSVAREAEPLLLGGSVWLAECAGDFDQVRVDNGRRWSVRLLL